MKTRWFHLAPFVAALLLAGCSDITGPHSILEQFNWEPVADPETVVEGIDVSVILGDLFVLGQLATPSPCYSLKPSFDHSGSTLTLRVVAEESNANTCDEGPGALRYTAVIRNIERGNYEFRVRHVVEGEVKEYTESVEI